MHVCFFLFRKSWRAKGEETEEEEEEEEDDEQGGLFFLLSTTESKRAVYLGLQETGETRASEREKARARANTNNAGCPSDRNLI